MVDIEKIKITKEVLKLGANEAIIYGILEYYNSLTFTNKVKIKDKTYFKLLKKDLIEMSCLNRAPVDSAIRKLIDNGYLEYKVAGLPSSSYFIVNDINSMLPPF